MKRIFSVLVVMAVMAAMLVATAAPAFAFRNQETGGTVPTVVCEKAKAEHSYQRNENATLPNVECA